MFDLFSAPGEWLRGNLHLHTTVSDGELSPQQAVDGYSEQGYDFLAITDHNIVVDVDELDSRGMTLLHGLEIAPGGGDLGQTIHTVGIGAAGEWEKVEDEPSQDTWGRLSALTQFRFVAHPSWSSLVYADVMLVPDVHGVEVFNTTCHRGIGRGLSEVQWDDCTARGRSLYGLAVDDAHCHYNDLYGGWVWLRAEERTPEAIYQALQAGMFYASTGPTIESVEVDGQTVRVECSPCLEALAVCPTAGRGSTSWRAGECREERTSFEFMLKPSSNPIRICVVDAAGRRAWTSYYALPE
jgi:hypothetical protein